MNQKQKKDRVKVEQLMSAYAQLAENKKALTDSIANELKAYNENMRKAEEEILEIAKRNRDQFDVEGNWVMDSGYVHAATITVPRLGKKLSMDALIEKFPTLVDAVKALRLSLVKKAFANADQRKEMKALGLDVTTEEQLQVIVK